jgi:hypothetical protein
MATYGQLMILASLDFDMVKYHHHTKCQFPIFSKKKPHTFLFSLGQKIKPIKKLKRKAKIPPPPKCLLSSKKIKTNNMKQVSHNNKNIQQTNKQTQVMCQKYVSY